MARDVAPFSGCDLWPLRGTVGKVDAMFVQGKEAANRSPDCTASMGPVMVRGPVVLTDEKRRPIDDLRRLKALCWPFLLPEVGSVGHGAPQEVVGRTHVFSTGQWPGKDTSVDMAGADEVSEPNVGPLT